MSEQHIVWIDALKGFGIVLVTFGHLSPWLPIETHIYSFHMCLFFFISGFLFEQRDSFKLFVKKKYRSILIPFLVWDILASMVALAFGEGLKNTITRLFLINGSLCWNAPIWFLLILFITEILYAFIMKANDSQYMIIVILICSVILWIIYGSFSFTLKLNLLPLAMFFYAFGDIIHRVFDEKSFSKATTISMIVTFGILNFIFGIILNIRISYTGGSFGNIYFCIIASISGTMLYYLIFKNWGNNNLLGSIGRNSLIIMATQYWFFMVYDFFSQKIFGVSVWHGRSTTKAFVVSIATITIIISFVSMFKYIFRNKKKILNLAKYIGIR